MNYLAGTAARTANTDVASALGAMDIRLQEEKRLEKLENGQVTFYFESESRCGKFQTEEMIRVWDDAEWQRDLPRHPLSYLRVFLRNRQRLLDHFEGGVQLAAVWREEKMLLVTRTGTRIHTEPIPKPAEGLATVRTDDMWLACALMACGVPLWAKRPWFRTGNGIVYEFQASSPCGKFRAAELSLAWQREDWWLEHRDHPFAYLWCAYMNHEFLTRLVRRKAPLVVIMKRGLPCMIPADAPDEVQKPFFKELKKL